MSFFTKKPITIEAWPVRDLLYQAGHRWDDLPEAVLERYARGDIVFRPGGIEILTLEGVMTGEIDDVLIKGVKGELYPCKSDIFEATYRDATEGEEAEIEDVEEDNPADFFQKLLESLRSDKPDDRSTKDRYYAIVITDVEKAYAVFSAYCGG